MVGMKTAAGTRYFIEVGLASKIFLKLAQKNFVWKRWRRVELPL